jgi:hypothetical protein
LAGAVYSRPITPLRPSSSATSQSALNKNGWVKNMEGDEREKGENVASIGNHIHKIEVSSNHRV